jgi:hypothetical protein
MVRDPLPRPIYAQIMSTYLLLRNNKESGPFSIEEIKGMSLKSYDLLWIVGKSAAWRYPGEISELKSFAPPIPEQPGNLLLKNKSVENLNPETLSFKKTEPANTKNREGNTAKTFQTHTVYVNLPAEKKSSAVSSSGVLYDSDFQSAAEPAPDFSYVYDQRPSKAVRITGKILWTGIVLLLFGTGILTGLFISDRRNIFSTDANHPQNAKVSSKAALNAKKEILPVSTTVQEPGNNDNITNNDPAVFQSDTISLKPVNNTRKKNLKNAVRKDSASISSAGLQTVHVADSSLAQHAPSKTEELYHKIKAHPENYIGMMTGKYTTGIFGGTSAIPVTVTNNAPEMIDLVVVDVQYIQNNDKVFKTEKLVFNDLEPGESLTEKSPKSPRGTKVLTRIRQITAHKMDLNFSN